MARDIAPDVGLTCGVCLAGRHLRCRGCACSICHVEVPRLKRTRRATRRMMRAKVGPRRKPGGPACPKGSSTLPAPMQAAVEAGLLVDGLSVSECARRAGCSRDKVRTIRDRWTMEDV